MTRLFVQFYLGVLIVLFLAWYIHGAVWQQRSLKDRARVFEEAHGGGTRLVANELNAATDKDRDQVLTRLRAKFDYPIKVISIEELPKELRARLASEDDVGYFVKQNAVVATLSDGQSVVQLGPFPDYDRKTIEDSMRGWMILTAEKLAACPADAQQEVLAELQTQFDFPITVEPRDNLPTEPQQRVASGATIAFYGRPNEGWFAATPLPDTTTALRSGPFPNFKRIDQNAATTTLALVLLPAAIAIALLLRPMAQQLRHVENAAKAIAAGDLGARVEERRVVSAKPLAQAFNNMAERTEALVRTQRELLQAVSHELRTPLSRIRFAIDLIESADNDAERRQRLASLDSAAGEIDELVGELLRYVRMETTEVELEYEPVAVHEVMGLLIDKYTALNPKIDFRLTSDPLQNSLTITANRLGFQRAIGNLISNAGRFAKHTVNINVAATDSTLTVDVDDDGCGIDDLDRERVFEPFVRLNGQSNNNGHGIGLGLALVQRIIDRHHGSVDVRNSPLGGCRIHTTWPIQSESKVDV